MDILDSSFRSSGRSSPANYDNNNLDGSSPGGRKKNNMSGRFEVASAMDRLRTSLIGNDLIVVRDDDDDDVSDVPFPHADLDSSLSWDITKTDNDEEGQQNGDNKSSNKRKKKKNVSVIGRALGQVPAVILIGMFHLMIGIPFGVSYFPIGWSNSKISDDEIDDGVNGAFPLPGKEALGIRMFLFSTVIGQIIFTYASGFNNPIGLQMVENVPFCHALSNIVIKHQGYGIDSLSTLFVMFGLASIVVGVVFYVLGRLQLGRVVYYFPTHVLVGCIGGIGVFIAKTGIEVTIDAVFGISSITNNIILLVPVLVFEVVLRILERINIDKNGKPRFSLLSPIYFCMITPIFYILLSILHFDMQYANDVGFFFPSLLGDCDSTSCSSSMMNTIFNKDLFDIWKVVNFPVVSWPAIVDSIPTLVALTLFSLIHVPINIPAFAISTNTEADMNRELVAHGYSNIIAGMFGGLQNYMAYTQSVLYDKSGGRGKRSGVAVAIVTSLLFFIGPTIASYIPRCMAGTLLLHVGIDLFLEGVYDSYGKFDHLEYAGIWLIVVVMTLYGMDAAMIAGGIAAVSTYAVQSIHFVNPIRGSMSAATLRSSRWNRPNKALEILNDDQIGRNRIFVVQLQGHLFFGNMAQLMDSINKLLKEQNEVPWIVILDFSLVLGIDSSAAQAIAKLRNVLHKTFRVELCIFVTGSAEGFPCEFNLSSELCSNSHHLLSGVPGQDIEAFPDEKTCLLGSLAGESLTLNPFIGTHVEHTLDNALIFAENALLARQEVPFLQDTRTKINAADEKDLAIKYLSNLCPGESDLQIVRVLFSYFDREVLKKEQRIWTQGSSSDCMKLLVSGKLISFLENEAGTSEIVDSGNTVGELGLVQGSPRMSSLYCYSEEAVLYSLSRESFDSLCRSKPQVVRLIDMICIRYLSARVQHVSNRIFETRCLPI